jgi:hypothetical protein
LAMAVATNEEVEALCADRRRKGRRHSAGTGYDGLRPDVPCRGPRWTSASRVLPCALGAAQTPAGRSKPASADPLEAHVAVPNR